jgi:arsenite methyltransferase
MNPFSQTVVKRYDGLSKEDCCLSCGNALSFAGIQTGEVCVDLGSGQGHDVLRMAILTGDSGFSYGIDISDGMIDTARNKAIKLQINHVAFIHSPLESLTLNNNIADVVISNCSINHSLDQAKVWQEIYRILKPGGRFVVSDIYALEEVPQVYAIDPLSVAECWAGAVVKERYIQNMIEAGMKNLEIIEESSPYKKGEIHVVSFTISGRKIAGK